MSPRYLGSALDADDDDVLEFLEGLLEGFRAAASPERKSRGPRSLSSAKKSPSSRQHQRGDWSQLDELRRPDCGRWMPDQAGPSAFLDKLGEVPSDSLQTLMRRHALRSYLEETCGTVANAFDVMAGSALRAALGATGTPQDRLRHLLTLGEFRSALTSLGYGVEASAAWWESLFRALDLDRDGAISIQDIYDTLVLDLPSLPEQQMPHIFFTSPPEERWRR